MFKDVLYSENEIIGKVHRKVDFCCEPHREKSKSWILSKGPAFAFSCYQQLSLSASSYIDEPT